MMYFVGIGAETVDFTRNLGIVGVKGMKKSRFDNKNDQ